MGIANQLRTIDAGVPHRRLVSRTERHADRHRRVRSRGLRRLPGASTSPTATARCIRATPRRASPASIDLADRHGVNFEGALTWAFEFEDQPYFAGFRSLATNGIDKPVLNVFRMFSMMSGKRLPVRSDAAIPLDEMIRDGVRGRPDVAGFASTDGKRLCVMLWHYHDDDVPGPDAAVELTIKGLAAGAAQLRHYRIDETHSNAFSAWKRMGSPQQPTPDQYEQLVAAGQLQGAGPPEQIRIGDQGHLLAITLPRQGVSLLVLEIQP